MRDCSHITYAILANFHSVAAFVEINHKLDFTPVSSYIGSMALLLNL